MPEPVYRPGDIVGVPSKRVLARLLRWAFEPHTDLFHWLVVYEYVPEESDYVVMECIPQGVVMGRLSRYTGKGYRVFRPVFDDPTAGERACHELTRYGRYGYDWLIWLKMLFRCQAALVRQLAREKRLHPIRPSELPYRADQRLTCTEAAVVGWERVGCHLVPEGVFPMPASFLQAVHEGRLQEVTEKGG